MAFFPKKMMFFQRQNRNRLTDIENIDYQRGKG